MTDHSSAIVLRRLQRGDLAAALTIQSGCYPKFLREDEAAFASRLEVAAPYCLAATRNGELAGYLLAHAWPRGSPPAVGALLPRDVAGEILYIHDLAVGSTERGRGIGDRLVAAAFGLAAAGGLEAAELIAVEGAERYWRRLGFVEAPCSSEVAAKVASYGSAARWMRRAIP